MEFEKRKGYTLASMESPEADKSPKGNLDTPIIPLINTINSHPSYFTTSSCSGRISILSQPKKKAKGGSWLFISHHYPVHPNSVLPLIFNIPIESNQGNFDSAYPQSLVFRFEPLIIAVECRDVEAAQTLVSLAILCGFRESGITSVSKKRVIIGIRCSIRLEVPLGDTNRIMVTPEYVEYLIQVAHEKMEANRKRTDTFYEALLRNGFSKNGDNGQLVNCKEIECSDEKIESLDDISCVGAESNDLDGTQYGSPSVSGYGLSVVQMEIVGQPVERLLIWGHAAFTLEKVYPKKILIFGGFGGIGRHARRNDLLLLDSESGSLEKINLQVAPSPRLGHTCSVVDDVLYIIGGRADPINILNDVWAFNGADNEFRQLQCSGVEFPPRHRHAAAVDGSVIYIFGGIHNDVITSSLYALDTQNLIWSKIYTKGDEPCARHSHTMEAYGSKIYLFGGYNGERALNDLYSFDIQTSMWKKEETTGVPNARFSHMMFVYKNYLGILGGCPINQNHQNLSLLDLQSRLWKNVNLSSLSKQLFVRSTASVIGNNLIIVGGGAACYAFGTKFSETVKINLLPLLRYSNGFVTRKIKEEPIIFQEERPIHKEDNFQHIAKNVEFQNSGTIIGHQMLSSHWVLRLGKKYGKIGKDLLKKFGWLDLCRKVWSEEDGMHICFPVTDTFCSIYTYKANNVGDTFTGLVDKCTLKQFGHETHNSKSISFSMALEMLMACGATKVADQVCKVRKCPTSPLTTMKEAVASLVSDHGLPMQILEQLPSRWERLGDIIVLPVTSFRDPTWDSVNGELWPIVARALGTRRLARQGRVATTGTRDSTLEMLVGDDGWVEHRENGILYSFDSTKCMFSWGNLSEKIRMGSLDCKDEVIVDLFAGIGYFVLPFLVRAGAKRVYACEWNPYAVEALRRNLQANFVGDRCIILEGDNRINAPRGIADRVCLGLLPTSEGSWVTGVRALSDKGGILHIHDNVKDSDETTWAEHVVNSILEISKSEGHNWEVSMEHIERVKWYAPHIRHLVADVRCKKV
ncbi:RNA methyltransferase [Lithospermum erythrorhizon]|uniref:RNA methyltransferase n=1 Tax=Lithospermum erythrorhizon TaxID=34254 RepID=A0AAV3Q4L9_LITER